MSKYKMIAFDMDGTLLNSRKEISGRTLACIERAYAAGKEVVISTGRCLPELYDYIRQIPHLRYLICVSGAMLYDAKEDLVLSSETIPPEQIRTILEAGRREDPMVHILSRRSIAQRSHVEQMERYHLSEYKPMFEKVTEMVDDIYSFYEQNPFPIEKLNLYHSSREGRDRTRSLLAGLRVVQTDADPASLECSPQGVTKGSGLLQLCRQTGIAPDEVIAVGDADNDLPILACAGLSVAMGNANSRVKQISREVVSDCDRDGCAEAIERFLL